MGKFFSTNVEKQNLENFYRNLIVQLVVLTLILESSVVNKVMKGKLWDNVMVG